MKYTEVQSFVKDLREFANFLENHGHELPSPYFKDGLRVSINQWSPTKEPLVKAAKVLTKAGMVKKEMTEHNYSVKQNWGNVELEYWASRDTVCNRKQVGTKQVAERKYVETGEMIEQPIYEYDCDPLLK